MKKTARWRLVLFGGVVLALAVLDFAVAPLTDPHAASGAGYGHRPSSPAGPDSGALRGYLRVRYNFRHFTHWWCAHPGWRGGWRGVVSSDGNSALTNLGGHLGGSFLLSLAGLWLVPWPWLILAAGTALNIFHELVAEGQYVDPSFVDLWLDQAGLLLALGLFALLRRWPARAVSGNR